MALLAPLVLGLVTSCSTPPVPEPTRVSPTISESGSAKVVSVPAGTVVATGRFVQGVTGTVRIVSLGNGDYSVRLSDLRGAKAPQLRVKLGAGTKTFNCAGVSGTNLDIGAVTSSPSQEIRLHRGYAPHADDDPSFLHALALSNTTDQFNGQHCESHTYALAPLTWTMPDLRPDLQVRNGPPRSGAAGSVDLHGGEPVRYHVSKNDTFTAIAARFNITVDDLYYLNPQRGVGADPQAKTGETLNLDRRAR